MFRFVFASIFLCQTLLAEPVLGVPQTLVPKGLSLDSLAEKFTNAKEVLTLEQVVAEFNAAIKSAKTKEEQKAFSSSFEHFKSEYFSSPEKLFNKFCPGARFLTTVAFPALDKALVELFVNYIIDQTNESLGFYFGKKTSQMSIFDIDVLLRELQMYVQYFETRKELGKKSDVYKRLKAFRLDYLFFKAYVIMLKGDYKYADRSEVDRLVKEIKLHIQNLVNTKYEHYYRKRLEMLELVNNKASGG